MCASRHTNTTVAKGEIVAGTRAIPLTVKKTVVDQAVDAARSAGGLFQIKRLRSAQAGLLITGNEVFSRLIEDRFEPILSEKLEAIGSTVLMVEFAPDDPAFIAARIKEMIGAGADLILTTAGIRMMLRARGFTEPVEARSAMGRPFCRARCFCSRSSMTYLFWECPRAGYFTKRPYWIFYCPVFWRARRS